MGRISTTCSGGYGGYYYLYLDYSLNWQSIESNVSNISLHLWAQSTSTSYHAYNLNSDSNSYCVTLNGSAVASGNEAMDFRNQAVVDLGSWSGNVGHNSDGTLSITIGGSFSISGTSSLSGGSISSAWSLPTIPRASTIEKFNNFTVGNGISIGLNCKSSSFTHNISLYVNGVCVAARNGIGTSYTLSLNDAEIDAVYKAMPNSASITATLYCATMNGSSQIGSTQNSKATAYISDTIVPVIGNITSEETVPEVKNIVGGYVQNLSKILFKVTNTSGSKYSTISNTYIVIDGNKINGSSVISDVINKSGDITITGIVTDSRGRTASKSITVNLLPYIVPSIVMFNVQRCNADGKLNLMGNYVAVSLKLNISSLLNNNEEKNNLSYELYKRERGTSKWVINKSESLNKLSFDNQLILQTYEVEKAFDFMLYLKDKFKTTISLNTIPVGQTTMSWSKNGVGIGKVWEKGALDVGGDTFVQGSVISTSDLSLKSQLVGDYDSKNNASKMIWTIGQYWNTWSNQYGLAYEYGQVFSTTPAGEHMITLRSEGKTYINLGLSGNAQFKGSVSIGSNIPQDHHDFLYLPGKCATSATPHIIGNWNSNNYWCIGEVTSGTGSYLGIGAASINSNNKFVWNNSSQRIGLYVYGYVDADNFRFQSTDSWMDTAGDGSFNFHLPNSSSWQLDRGSMSLYKYVSGSWIRISN